MSHPPPAHHSHPSFSSTPTPSLSNSAATNGNGGGGGGGGGSGANGRSDGNETPPKRSRNDSGPQRGNSSGDQQHSSSQQQQYVPRSFPPSTNSSFSTHPASPPRNDTLPLRQSSSSIIDPSSSPPPRTCLLIIDVQNDFCTGSLKAPDALSIIPVINQLRVRYDWDLVVFTADAHPTDHVSFYINHASDTKAQLLQPYRLSNGAIQVLWPVHCVKSTWGAQLHNDLIKDPSDVLVEKGTEQDQEFYSAFVSTDGRHQTHLSALLHSHGITHLAACGLVYEYCVGNSALDAASEGFKTCVLSEATRGLTQDGMEEMTNRMKTAGVNVIQVAQLEQQGFRPKVHLQLPSRMLTSPTRSASASGAASPSASSSPRVTPSLSSPLGAASAYRHQHPQLQQHYAAAAMAASPHRPYSNLYLQ